MDEFLIVLNQLIIFIIITVIGYMAFRFKMFKAEALDIISKLFMRIVLPCFIFANTVNTTTKSDVIDCLYIIPISIMMYICLISLSHLMVKIFRVKADHERLFRMISIFGNVGFIGIPLITSIYTESAMMYVAMFTIVDQFTVWTYGFSLSIPKEKLIKGINLKNLKNLLNPALISIVLAIIVIMFDIKLPAVLNRTFVSISSASMLLSFVYIGGTLCCNNIRKSLKCVEIYGMIFLKMILFPIFVFAALSAAGLKTDLVGTTTILAGLPSLGVAAMLAKQNGSDDNYATGAILMTTISCLFTVPTVIFITTVIL